jgi:DNA-binding response OmpR family regulator
MLGQPDAEQLSKAPRALRIIVADDDRDTVLTLMMVLRHEGHEVRSAHNGKQVLSALQEFEADALLLDIAMPELSGWEVAQKIKDRYGDRKPLLIGMSGKFKQGADKILSNLVGFDHYLLKPYEPSDVLTLLAPLRYPEADQD